MTRTLRYLATLLLCPSVPAAVAAGQSGAQRPLTQGSDTVAAVRPAQPGESGGGTPAASLRPRRGDPRINYIRVGDLNPVDTPNSEYIVRFRLEKRDPAAAVSDVVRPIVYYMNSNIPAQWRPWIETGIKAWLPVLESIGFRNALVIKPEEGPPSEGIPEDTAVHISFDENVSGAATVPTADTSTGETLGAVIRIEPTIMLQQCLQGSMYGDWPAVQPQHPCPDSIAGRLLQMIITHEVGHTLGLNHNFKAASVYPTDSLRNASFVHRRGHTPSVMSYAYFNYVAQPEDHIPLDDLLQRIGPYDVWALTIAYRPLPGATTPDAERAMLERWRSAQDTAPYLRSTVPQFSNHDPGDRPGVLGNDILKGTAYGLHNLERYASRLTAPPDTATQATLAKQWGALMSYQMGMVGGLVPLPPYHKEIGETAIEPVDSARQVQAFDFLISHLLYGRDGVVGTVVGRRTAGDTSAPVLFDSVAPGWDATPWQQNRMKLWAGLLDQNRLAALGRDTDILPAICPKLRAADQALATAIAAARTPGARTQAEALRQALEPTLGAQGQCHSPSAKTP